MFIGTLCPGIANIIYLAGFSPYGMDMAPFGLSMLAICYFIALFRYDLLELGEIIRSVAFSEISEGIIVVDDRKRLIDFNNAAQKIFNWLDVKNIGMYLWNFEKGSEIAGHGGNSFELEMMQNGRQRSYEFRITDLKEKNKILGSVYFIRDITEQKEMIKALDNMASYDSLTQVYNRRRFMEEAEKEALRVKRHKGCLSVLMMDFDLFKEINDKYGHLAGDEVIRAVAKVCRERIRRTDIMGRYGGEEFVIILSDTTLKDALCIADSIRRQIETMEIVFCDIKISTTVSIGVASMTGKQEEVSILETIKWADNALYIAKNNGRNSVSCDEVPSLSDKPQKCIQ
jgi:diguanylate cyclase (GGDEF)-like protein